MSFFESMPSAPAVPMPPPPPTLSTATVSARADEVARGQRGRASTFMTDPATQLDAGPSRQRVLGGV